MAELTDLKRKEVMRAWAKQAFLSDTANLTTNEIKSAVDAIDAWLESNAGLINDILPQPFKGTATIKQKASLLAFVTLSRYDVI